MAAGKMFVAARARKSRRPSNFKKAVTAIAKKTIMRQAETKTASVSVTGTVGLNGKVDDIWSKISQGDAQNNREGDRIKAMGVKLRGLLSIDPVVITTNQDNVVCRMLVVSGKRPLTSIADMGLTYISTVDPELLNVHHDSLFTFKLDGRTRVINKYIKFNRNILYNPTGAQPSKNEFYVVVIPYQTVAAGLTATTGVYLNYIAQPYWKDL